MEASTSNGPDGVKTFRGKSLEELLPQIRAELGPDAIVLRRREGHGRRGRRLLLASVRRGRRARSHVRRAPAGDPLRSRDRRGPELARRAGAVRAGDAVRRRARRRRARHADGGGHVLRELQRLRGAGGRAGAEPEPRAAPHARRAGRARRPPPPGLYGPQPNAAAIRDARRRDPEPEPEPRAGARAGARAPSPPEPEPGARAGARARPRGAARASTSRPRRCRPASPIATRPPSADAAEERLIAAGLSAALAADVVGEAVVHGLPFSAPRNMKRLVRSALARRIPTPTAIGPAPRTIAFVGGGGSGKSSAVAHLAAVYAAAGAEVAVIDLRGDHGLAGPPAAARHRRDRGDGRRPGQGAPRARASP